MIGSYWDSSTPVMVLWLLLWLLNHSWSWVSFRAQRKRNTFVPLSKFWSCGRFGEEKAKVTKISKSYGPSAPLASGPLFAKVTRSFPTSELMCSSLTFSRVPCFHRPPGNQSTSQRKCCSRRVRMCPELHMRSQNKTFHSDGNKSLSSRNLVIHILL